ncbi:hypothetical protein [uncultured Nostoc sp.]|uniref:hypothetical protein n=1 Tax=uncultured Nostoc sp. TaxID=340711 RepID=UPI001DAD7CEC|nr:hypothetical protein [Nostoc indistinguendum CM1-VF10]
MLNPKILAIVDISVFTGYITPNNLFNSMAAFTVKRDPPSTELWIRIKPSPSPA